MSPALAQLIAAPAESPTAEPSGLPELRSSREAKVGEAQRAEYKRAVRCPAGKQRALKRSPVRPYAQEETAEAADGTTRGLHTKQRLVCVPASQSRKLIQRALDRIV